MQELTLNNPEDFDDVVRNYVRNYGSVEIRIPDWREDLLARATRICGGYSVCHCDMFNVFSYKRFVGAFLEFEASYKPMCDGTLTVLIHGFAGDEKLKITTHAEKSAADTPQLKNTTENASLSFLTVTRWRSSSLSLPPTEQKSPPQYAPHCPFLCTLKTPTMYNFAVHLTIYTFLQVSLSRPSLCRNEVAKIA